jgi:ELWxxDGT repeat protein
MTVSELELEDFAGIICIEGVSSTEAQMTGQELWRSDGSYEGTYRLDDVYAGSAGSFPKFLTSFGNYLYFSAYTRVDGRELWRTKGHNIGEAEMVSLLSSGIYPGSKSSDPTDLTVAGDLLFFAATNRDNGTELWVTFLPGQGGVEALRGGEVRNLFHVDIYPGSGSSSPLGFEPARDSVTGESTLPIYFSATLSASGRELWVSDGTASGTMLVKDINPGMSDSNPNYLTWYRGSLYFQANDGSHGRELFVSDGSESGTVMLKDIRPGVYSGSPAFMTVLSLKLPGLLGKTGNQDDEYLFFIATDGLYASGKDTLEGFGGSQLWRTDGTVEGTRRAFERTQNDLYFDHISMDMAHPARMIARNHQLIVPAKRGGQQAQGTLSRAGFKAQSEEALNGIDQAAVISDIDAPEGAILTVELSVSKGLMVLPAITRRLSATYDDMVTTTTAVNTDGVTTTTTSGVLKILVVDSEVSNRLLLSGILVSLNHEVVVENTGTAAYEAIKDASLSGAPFDLVILDMEVPEWDGRQLARMIRHWENEQGVIVGERIVMVGTGSSHELVIERSAALQAGMNEFFQRPFKDYVSGELNRVDWTEVYNDAGEFVNRWSSKSQDVFEEEQEKLAYLTFVDDILSFLRESRSMQEIVKLTVEPLVSTANTPLLAEETLDSLPGPLVSSGFTLEGQINDINTVLRTLYYYPPNGTLTVGDAVLTITATDRLEPCSTASITSVSQSLRDAPKTTAEAVSECNIRDASASSTAEIRIVVTGKNQAPVITIDNEASLTELPASAEVGGEINMDFIFVSDPDFDDVPALTDSFGFAQLPPVTVSLSADLGYLTFQATEGISLLTQLSDTNQRTMEIYGSIDKINAAIQTMKYVCRAVDGCYPGFTDQVHLLVGDGGYSGQGGALTAHMDIPISITAPVSVA